MGELIDKAKGKTKKAVGTVIGSEGLKEEGQREVNKGKVKGAVEDVKDAAKDLVK
jgi:uncharacterized protein YjbJ (UPF0337 family)